VHVDDLLRTIYCVEPEHGAVLSRELTKILDTEYTG